MTEWMRDDKPKGTEKKELERETTMKQEGSEQVIE
jgi:hypothetical protein